jgi:hypothetical protein
LRELAGTAHPIWDDTGVTDKVTAPGSLVAPAGRHDSIDVRTDSSLVAPGSRTAWRPRVSRLAVCVVLFTASLAVPASAEDQIALPTPLRVGDAMRIARTRRLEVIAARARARGAAERPTIVSALDDPEIFGSIDHLPFMGGGVDASFAIEQRFPLSSIRGDRRRAAEAGARRELAIADKAGLDVELEAASAFWMLAELRERARLLDDQRALADQMAAAALARFSTSAGMQADVFRAQLEVERLAGEQRAIIAELRAAEAMLDTSLARSADAAIIMIENAHKQIEHDTSGRPRREILIEAAQQVGRPLFYSLLIITVSFLPIFSLEAQEVGCSIRSHSRRRSRWASRH